jgi:hypothetical protein
MRTIIQHIGPLYGELNTGSVFGQPNGSVAVSQNLVPTPSEPTKEEVEIWTLSYYTMGKIYDYGFRISNNWSFLSLYNASTASSNLCTVKLLSDITETNTVTKLQIATDEAFTDIVFSGNIATPSKYVEASFTNVDKPTLTGGKVYYIRLLLYASSGAYLYKKSRTLSMTFRNL